MDLAAYTQIDRLEGILRENNISIPRIRGIRLMSEQRRHTEEDVCEVESDILDQVAVRLVCAVPPFSLDPRMVEFSPRTDRLKRKYLVGADGPGSVVFVRWSALHGKFRKNMKFAFKKVERTVRRSCETFDKYVGRDDVICVHARIGGKNWEPYGGLTIEKEPWFIERVDDPFDHTYCNIYIMVPPRKETEKAP